MDKSLTMQLGPSTQRPGIRHGLECESESEAVNGYHIFTPYFTEQEKRIVGIIGVGESADEGVVHEGVWVRKMKEEAASVDE